MFGTMNMRFAFAVLRRDGRSWDWVIPHCPFCRHKHTHGAGTSAKDARGFLGSRVPHCAHQTLKNIHDHYWLTDDPTLHGHRVPEDWSVNYGRYGAEQVAVASPTVIH